MKKIINILILVMMIITLSGCSNEYKGYWCNYDENSTIVVLLKKEHKESDKTKIEKKIDEFENVSSMNFYSKEDYAQELGEDADTIDIYDTYVISFDSMDSIGTYIEELEKMDGVASAEQSSAKSNISLYFIDNWNKYTFTDSDEANTQDIEKGKYKIKKGVIIFTPENTNAKQKMLYTKDGHLCGNADCTEIFAKSNSSCTFE